MQRKIKSERTDARHLIFVKWNFQKRGDKIEKGIKDVGSGEDVLELKTKVFKLKDPPEMTHTHLYMPFLVKA